MIINKLSIKGFGKIKDLEIGLAPGLNIIYGKNEAGKSTLQQFIKAMFYGLRGGREKGGLPSPIKRFKPWINKQYGGSIDYTLSNGKAYKISRNFNDNSVSIFDGFYNDITPNFKLGKGKRIEIAEEHFGLNEVCFEKTAFIGQMDVRVDGDGKEEIINKLINIEETGFEDISFRKAEKALKEAIITYTATDRTIVRPLDKVNERLTNLKAEYSEIKSKRDSLTDIREGINKVKTRIDRCKEKNEIINTIREVLIKTRELIRMGKAKEELHEIRGHLILLENEYNDTKIKINTIKTNLSNSGNLDDNLGIGTFYHLETGTDNIEERVMDLKDEITNLNNEILNSKINAKTLYENILRVNKERKYGNIGIITIPILGILASGIFFLMLREMLLVPTFLSAPFTKGTFPLIIKGIGLATFIITILLWLTRRNIVKKFLGLSKREGDLEIYIKNLNRKLGLYNIEINKILDNYGAKNIREFFKTKAELDEKRMKFKDLEISEKRAGELEQSINIYLERVLGLTGSHINEAKELTREINGITQKIEKDISDLRYLIDILNNKISGNSILDNNITDNDILYNDVLDNTNKKIDNKDKDGNLEQLIPTLILNISHILRDNEERDFLTEDKIINQNRFRVRETLLKNISEIEENIEEEAERLREEKNVLNLNLKEYSTILNTSGYDSEELQTIVEQIEELEKEKRNLENVQFSLYKALEVMTQASLEIQKDYMPFLNDKMEYYIEKVTGGKYRDLKADDKLTLRVQDPENINIIPVLQLSEGAIDQVYLVLRLAMSDLISRKQESLPLILDEIFAHFDDIRFEKSMDLLNSISRKRQIIMFTCKKREVEFSREISNKTNILKLEM